jgi:membrane associated rhomboid family serine protease
MNWIHRAEAKFGHFAVPHLPEVIASLNLLVYLLHKLAPNIIGFLFLDLDAVLHGEVWRLVTFLFIPTLGDPIFLLFYLMYILVLGRGLEQAMGSFQFTLYYALGAFGQVLASLIVHGNAPGGFANSTLNTTMLFAYERFFPEAVFYVLFVLPVKVKWMVWLSAAFTLLLFLGSGNELRGAILAAFLNYLIFFGPGLMEAARHRHEVAERRQRFTRDSKEGAPVTMHECVVCKRTEVSAPELDFRVARDGQEYCVEHLPKPPALSAS